MQPAVSEVLQASALHTSGISQALLASVLTSWGPKVKHHTQAKVFSFVFDARAAKGWDKHVANVQGVYARRRDWMLGFCERYLKDNATWTAPSAGVLPLLAPLSCELILIGDGRRHVPVAAVDSRA
jgi:DNA-binding transcriptional MocR family regulator